MNIRLKRAMTLAKFAHDGQIRKYSGEAYVHHPIRVAKKIKETGCKDINVIIAAILHDTVEDTFLTLDNIKDLFGPIVARYVEYSTSKSQLVKFTGNREARKKYDMEHYLEGFIGSYMIKIADMTDNCSSIIKEDPKFARTYLPEKERLIRGFYDKASKSRDLRSCPNYQYFTLLYFDFMAKVLQPWKENEA